MRELEQEAPLLAEPSLTDGVVLAGEQFRIAPPPEMKPLEAELVRQIMTACQVFAEARAIPDKELARHLCAAAVRMVAASNEFARPSPHWVLPFNLTAEQLEARVLGTGYLYQLAKASVSTFQAAKHGHLEVARDGCYILSQRIQDSLSAYLGNFFAVPESNPGHEWLN